MRDNSNKWNDAVYYVDKMPHFHHNHKQILKNLEQNNEIFF